MLPLDIKQAGFSWVNARALAERCAAAYQAGGQKAEDGSRTRLITNAQTDTEALVILEPDCVSVSFRGSRNLRDWIQDFKVAKEHPRTDLVVEEAGDVVQVHTGFMQDVESVSEELTHALRNLVVNATGQKPVFVTGHSKGGSEAILFALELARQNFVQVAGVYTFGQPRVGNAVFRRVYNDELRALTWRVVNENDIVPRVPLWTMGYRHCGQEIFLPVGGGWCLNPGLGSQLLSDAMGLWGAWRQERDVLVSEHAIGSYQKRIQFL